MMVWSLALNSAYSCFNKLQQMDMDAVVSLSHTILQTLFCTGDGGFNIPLSNGEILSGRVHRSWGCKCALVGRTLDLTAAYKQLAVSPDQGFVRVLTAYDPFVINALPFGATSSVYGFNRVAKSLWRIMASLGAVWTTQYFDDFPNVEMSDLASNSRSFMKFILHALGWKYAMDMEGKKAEHHSSSFKVLGVELDP